MSLEDLPDDILIRIVEMIHDFDTIFKILPSVSRRIRSVLKIYLRYRSTVRVKLYQHLDKPRALASILKRVHAIDTLMLYHNCTADGYPSDWHNIGIDGGESSIVIVAKACRNLRGLHINCLNNISPAFFSRLSETCKKLTSLNIKGVVNEIHTHTPGPCPLLHGMSLEWAGALRRVTLPVGNWVTSKFVDTFLEMCTSLIYLNIPSNSHSMRLKYDAIATHLPHIQTLELRHYKCFNPERIDDERMYNILRNCRKLHTLKGAIYVTETFGVGIQMPICSSLVHVDLSRSSITDEGLFRMIKSSPVLKDLGISRCTNLTGEGVARALRAFDARALYVGWDPNQADQIVNIIEIIAISTKTLTSLTMWQVAMDLEKWNLLLKANPNITGIRFSTMEITDEVIIAADKCCRKLEWMDFIWVVGHTANSAAIRRKFYRGFVADPWHV
jgi:hypothetical protein